MKDETKKINLINDKLEEKVINNILKKSIELVNTYKLVNKPQEQWIKDVEIVVQGTLYLNMILNRDFVKRSDANYLASLEIPAIAKSFYLATSVYMDPSDRLMKNIKKPILFPKSFDISTVDFELAWARVLALFKKSDVERVKWIDIAQPVSLFNILDNLVYISDDGMSVTVSSKANSPAIYYIDNNIIQDSMDESRFSCAFEDYIVDCIRDFCLTLRA